MLSYCLNVVGLGFNFLATLLLLQYSPDAKSAGDATVIHWWERDFVPTFREAIRNGQWSIVLLTIGFGLQLFGTLLQKLDCP